MTSPLTHFDAQGQAHMVDVSAKAETHRVAVARGHIRMLPATLALILAGEAKKGDVLGVARIAAIQGAKRCADLVPLCHPIAVHGVDVDLDIHDDHVAIRAVVRTADRTGVEMEALTCVAVAGLALIDMVKAVDPAAEINDVHVDEKTGGKTGLWQREG